MLSMVLPTYIMNKETASRHFQHTSKYIFQTDNTGVLLILNFHKERLLQRRTFLNITLNQKKISTA
jgi:hypothetical protein